MRAVSPGFWRHSQVLRLDAEDQGSSPTPGAYRLARQSEQNDTSAPQATPCSQSQIEQDRYLRKRLTTQVEAAPALSVVVRWGPVRTAVNGRLVARVGERRRRHLGGDGSSSARG
jgi:hypothetical protein